MRPFSPRCKLFPPSCLRSGPIDSLAQSLTAPGVPMPTEKDIRKALRKVKDPELNLDLVVLGLIYGIEIEDTHVRTRISLTSPFCPAANQILEDTKAAVLGVEGVESAEVDLTFDPPWSPERIDPLIRSSLGI